jgi:hypothetical protein
MAEHGSRAIGAVKHLLDAKMTLHDNSTELPTYPILSAQKWGQAATKDDLKKCNGDDA